MVRSGVFKEVRTPDLYTRGVSFHTPGPVTSFENAAAMFAHPFRVMTEAKDVRILG